MTLNCNGTLVDLSSPKILGILNLTPDSFYDGGKHQNISAALKQCEKMITEGTDFIDLGAYRSQSNGRNQQANPCFNRTAQGVSHHPIFH